MTYPKGRRHLSGGFPVRARAQQPRLLLQLLAQSEKQRLIGEAAAVRPVCSRGPLAQPCHRFPFPMAQTNPPLPCCSSFSGGPGAAPTLTPTLAGVGALGGSSRIARGVSHPEAPGAGARRATEPAMAARTAIAANCFLFRSEKNHSVCAVRARGLVAPSLVSLLPGQQGLAKGSR